MLCPLLIGEGASKLTEAGVLGASLNVGNDKDFQVPPSNLTVNVGNDNSLMVGRTTSHKF